MGRARLPSFHSRDVVTHSGAKIVEETLKHNVLPFKLYRFSDRLRVPVELTRTEKIIKHFRGLSSLF